jgi:hypothetical protein
MTDQAGAERTRICGRAIEAFNSSGKTLTVDLVLERVGPPVIPVSGIGKGTVFVLTLTYTGSSGPVVISEQGDTMWTAFLGARSVLDERGWLLPIAGARTDSWNVFAARRPENCMVVRMNDHSVCESFLMTAPTRAVGTVDAQQNAWLRKQFQDATPESSS